MHNPFRSPLSLLLALTMAVQLTTSTADVQQQIPLPMNPESSPSHSTVGGQESTLMLTELLTLQNSASIFYSYARETELSALFGDEGSRSTVFAPTNKAVMALARKPHQGPEAVDEGIIISEQEFDERSRKNVERWVSAHIIPRSPIQLSPTSQFETLLEGCVVTISMADDKAPWDSEKPSWTQVVLNDNITVLSRHEAANGVLYLIDGTIYG